MGTILISTPSIAYSKASVKPSTSTASTPQTLLLERLHDYDGPPYVVILDEVDQLDNPGVLYELHRAPNLSMILIGNQEEQFFSRLDGRVASRLHTSTRIKFNLYDNDELIAILEDRVQWGLHPDIINTSQLCKIADAAAGDARVAIGILRTAARQTTQHSAETLEIPLEWIYDPDWDSTPLRTIATGLRLMEKMK